MATTRRWAVRHSNRCQPAHVTNPGQGDRDDDGARANEAMLRVWLDAAFHDPAVRIESAPLFDWGRRRMARYLRTRGFGDVEIEAVIMVALLSALGARHRPAEVDAAALIIERGLLGR
jgi:hypothetical protein